MSKRMFAIALIALLVSGCGVSHKVATEQVKVDHSERRDSTQVEKVMVAVHDTIVETTTIHIQTNVAGDTLKVAQVTERDRIRDRAQVRNKEVEVRVVHDTIYVEQKAKETVALAGPGVEVKADGTVSAGGSGLRATLRVLVLLVVAIIGLVFIIKFKH